MMPAYLVENDDAVPPLDVLARQMLVSLASPHAPRVLSKIGLGQAIYALQTAIENFTADPEGLYNEGRNICATFPHIAHRYQRNFDLAVETHKSKFTNQAAPSI
jgi:hypothetical protein